MPTSPTPRLAIFGTFDVENYGDLLFPLVARQRLSAQGIEVVAVSPTDGETRYRDALRPISQAAFASDAGAFDAVLIGGGNIIHTRDFSLPGYGALAYAELWAGATAHAVRHGLSVIWNAPGVLAPGTSGPPPVWLSRTVAAADRFAVRDPESADAMEAWSGRRPLVMPDTALDLPSLWPREMLEGRFAALRGQMKLPEGRAVVALHVKARSLGGMSAAAFADALSATLDANNAVAVLLAIGRCHGDHEVVQAIHRAAPARSFAFDDADALMDIAAVIAGADAYLGASLHGHITAAAYGVPARVVAVPALHKFAGQAAQMGRSGDLVADWETALRELPACLAGPRQALPDAVASDLDAHWDETVRLISGGRRTDRHPDIFDEADPEQGLAAALLNPSPPSKAEEAPAAATKSKAKDAKPLPDWDRAAIERMISGGEFDAAALKIAEMLGAMPSHLPARLAEVRLALAKGDFARADELSGLLWTERPDNHWVWLARLQCLVRAGSLEAAQAVFREGVMRPEFDDQAMNQATGDLLAAFPVPRQIEILRAAIAERPDSTTLQIKLAMRAHANGDHQLALDMFKRLEKSGPLPAYAQRARNQLLPFEGSMDSAVERIAAQVEGGATDVETLCRLSRFAASAGRFDLAAEALGRALALHPLEWRTVYRLNRVFLGGAQDAAIFERLARLEETASPNASWRLQYALFALRAGQEKHGRRVLEQLSGADVVGPTARTLLAALDSLGEAAPRAPVIADDHVRVVRQPGARGTLLMFGGLLGGLSHLNDRHLDTLLATLPLHVIYLRDPHGRAFLKGVPELGEDEAAMHAALSRLVAELGSKAVITMGGSAAGYSALRAGLAIGAGSVISLAGFVTPGAAKAGETVQNRQALEELFGGEGESFDLRSALRSRPDVRLTHVAGSDYAPDLARAQALDGIPNASVHIMPGVDTHHVALPAITNGLLKRLLEDALAA